MEKSFSLKRTRDGGHEGQAGTEKEEKNNFWANKTYL